MGHRRHGIVVALLVLATLARADQGPPVYAATGTQPVAGGACSGPRVQVGATTGSTWCCVASVWVACGASAGSSPGGVSGNLQTNNGSGGFGAYAATACGGSQYVSGISASGALTCGTPTASVPDATASVTGGVRLTGDLGGTATSPTVPGLAGKAPSTSGTSVLLGNGTGGFSSYGGGTCTGANLVQALSSSGAPTCYQLKLGQVAAPSGDTTFTFPSGAKILWTFTGNTDVAFSIDGDGAFAGTGDLVHIHKAGTGSTTGADALHVEVTTDTNMNGIRITTPSSSTQAILATGKVDVTGTVTATAFSGPLTGAVTGNASTATALSTAGAANQYWKNGNVWGQVAYSEVSGTPAAYSLPAATATVLGGVKGTGTGTACTGGQYALGHDAAGALTCGTPAGTYSLPAASTTLGGVKMAAACGAGNHVSSIGAAGELTCTADSGGGGAPTTAQYWVGAADAGLSAEKDLSGFTGLVLNTAGTPSAKAANTCTNQFARSDTASGVWTCASITAADLPVVTVADGGSGLSTVAADQIYVATATDTFTAKSLPSCSNASTSKLLYDTATHAFSCGTDSTSAGATTLEVTGSDYTNSTVTPSTVLSTAVNNATEYGFQCVLVNQGTATGGIRYNINGPSASNVAFVTERFTTTSAQTLLILQAFSASAQTATCTASCNATNLITKIKGSFTTTASGTFALQASSSTAGQAVVVRRGSYCTVY